MRQEQEVKDIHIGREETKLSLFADGMTVYVQNPKALMKPNQTKQNTTKLELISNCSKVTGYKVHIQKSFAFLYTSNKQLEF